MSPLLKEAAANVSNPDSSGRSLKCCVPSASSYALPAPNPVPSHTGHDLLLNNRTENMTPKEKPSEDLMTKEEIARSHWKQQELALFSM